ncbi:MAG: peptide deformylase [Spirochaetales bacterium]|nr:peptide deformylase [Spirochaetales bacterium]
MDFYTLNKEEEIKVLRTLSQPVENIDGKLVEFADAMVESIAGKGIGLAAPQVGRNERFFVVQLSEEEKPLYFFNPQIIGTSDKLSSYDEGCLSIPEINGKIKRPAIITVQAWNRRGRPFTIEAEGLLATVIQHEYDHLNGKLFIDYLPERKRAKIAKHFGLDIYPQLGEEG